jgi:RNA polymerase sigma-70 factor, ECF subfamily
MISEPDRRDALLTHLASCEHRLRAFITGALAAADDRADFFQDVVLILWRNFDKYDATRPFLPWALGIAVRRLKEEYRRARRRPGLLEMDHLERLAHALESSAPEEGEGTEERALNECLAGLPPHSAKLIRGRYFEQRSVASLCRESGLTSTALYQTLSRLRRRLAACIRERTGKSCLHVPAERSDSPESHARLKALPQIPTPKLS